ncbi:MAG: ATP-binding cassette domain-containing protein, partial [Haemophilus parainfluenzae]|nr:ATP-binding cassette domain-containing protein [Haemophilus parainfluenzae]
MIKLNNVVFNYQSMPMVFDLQIQAQEKIAIIGESGAGKSTLLNLIAGFEYADSGEIWLNGENHTKTAPFERHVSMLFQENNLFTHLSVEENIALGLKPNLALNAEEKALVEQAASAVNLQDFLTRKPIALSGGQKQRVALARCLLRDKPIL